MERDYDVSSTHNRLTLKRRVGPYGSMRSNLNAVNPDRQTYAISSRTRRAVRVFDTDASVMVPAEKATDMSRSRTDELSSADSPSRWPGSFDSRPCSGGRPPRSTYP